VEFEQDDLDRTSKSLNLQSSISIFDPANLFDYKAAGASSRGAHLDVINSEQDLIYSVKGAYYSYLAAVENVAVQEQAVERSAEQLKLIQSKYDLGSASKSEVLKQKVQYGNDKLTLLSAQNSAITTRATLAYTVGVDPASDVEFATEYLVRSYSGSLRDAIAFGLEYEPGLLSAHSAIDAARNSVKARKSDYLPKLIGFGSIDWSDGSSGFTATGTYSARSTTVGFQASWNIFDGFSRESRLTNAKVNRANAMAAAADAKNLVVRDIKTAYLEIEQRKKQQEVADENVAAADEDQKITQEKYNLGAATILDLLDAQVSLKSAQVSKIRADFELNTAVARLENAMGKM
jgi:outer membrane protein